jgi:hypothetical protein
MEDLTKTDYVLIILALYLFVRIFKELAWIKLYSFVLKLKVEGKLNEENESLTKIVEKVHAKLLKNRTKLI